ncbi:MAG: hypothetical protein JSU04_07990 [Bdellovibrionales bacterium]|nr:hypothetical protein [Bdellovibrionales bacterium]
MKTPNKSVVVLFVVLLAGFIHTFPLWNWKENVAGGYGDPTSHATIAQWYCGHVLTGNFHSDQFLAPFGADMSGTYDSPFPFALTCAFGKAGTILQFHLFTLFQIWLILLGAWLVATVFIKSPVRQLAYILFVWWCGFYVARTHQHMTLLSSIWGIQFILYAALNLDISRFRTILVGGVLLGLSFVGTFHNIPMLSIFALILVIYKLWEQRSKLNRKILLYLTAGVAVSLGIFLVFWWPMIAYSLKNGPVLVDSDRRAYNLDLLSPLIPFDTSLLYQWWSDLPKLSLERQNYFDPLILIIFIFSLCKRQFWKDSFRVCLLGVSIFYFIISLGPELRFNNEVLAYLDFNSELLHSFPFRITRTPGRLLLVTNMCLIFSVFLFLEQSKEGKWKKCFSWILVAWAIFTGPLLNQMWFFPTLKYLEVFPMAALEQVRNMPNETIVVQVPTAWAQDPSQNFQQIFHNKKITSGYLAYTNYNKEVQEKFSKEPFLGRLGCEGESTAFEATPLMTNSEMLYNYMKMHRYEVIIVNKLILLGNPACGKLTSWLKELVKQPWIKVIAENNAYVVLMLP